MIRNFLLSGLLIFGACSKAPELTKRKPLNFEPIQNFNAIELLAPDDSRNFLTLPLVGDARDQNRFWSGHFWPRQKGSINRRWNAIVPIGFHHRSPTLEELRTWTAEKISELAPSEKYDLMMGNYDYPLRKEVNQIAANEDAEIWEGMISGWAVASFLQSEPRPKVLTNPEGILISFGSEDIKGLLAYYFTYHDIPETDAMAGRPCQKSFCADDVSAATFHLALANSIGIKKKAFLMDLDRTRDEWNHPVVAYQSEFRGNAEIHDKVTPGTHSVIKMKTIVTYIDEALNQTWGTVLGSTHQLETTQIYQYWLHLDNQENVIGGEWKSNERPDYLWTVSHATDFKVVMGGLQNLVNE